jgi:uncharacterized membrane protein YuzA (DUF378 family)
MGNKALTWTALSLVIFGAVNWGLIGLFKFDLIATVLGGQESFISRIIYVIIALAGLFCISLYMRIHTDEHEHHRVHGTEAYSGR